MTSTAEQLLEKLLALPEGDRAELAARLIESLDPHLDQGAADEWDEEIRRRVGELEAGAAKTIPWEVVHRSLVERIANHGK
jgi:putative addiction module component (TIGR02574 family)